MRANEFLTELANFSYEILLRDVKANGEIRYYFETEAGDEYEVKVEVPFDANERAVGFQLRTEGGWTDRATGTAGSGSIKVFATVIQCVKDALATAPEVDTLYFTVNMNEPSRLALYQRFASNVSRYLPGWRKIRSPFEPVPGSQVIALSRTT
jgi:hypothetical protein